MTDRHQLEAEARRRARDHSRRETGRRRWIILAVLATAGVLFVLAMARRV